MPPNSGTRRPTQERAKATREHILDSAARLFGEHGIANTSTNRIATEAGVSVGTVYRHFTDRTVMVDKLIERLLENAEQRFTQRVFGLAEQTTAELMASILEVITDELMASAQLIRALSVGVSFYDTGIPELELRLRLFAKVLVIQLLGPGDDHKYDIMSIVLVNTGIAAALRASVLENDSQQRRQALTITARAVAAWIESERTQARPDAGRMPDHRRAVDRATPGLPRPADRSEYLTPPRKATSRPTQERAKVTREHILDTAARLFGEHGIANTSTNRIAAEAGVSVNTVYRHFSDRTDIVEELLEKLLESIEQHLIRSVSDSADRSVLELAVTILEAITDELVVNAPLVRALAAGLAYYNSGLPGFEPRLRALLKVLLIRVLGPGNENGHDVIAFVLVNVGFAAAVRAALVDADTGERQEIIAMTARLIAAGAEAEIVASSSFG
ncbi:TetR/AcrR family transcriptional regulator [Nocardia barduliensis]|uniref:TetR/AcrR family transcriptional regulator n=1 Tax=Nocardia barduliensis TaxID=2736643 RepID=UPI001FE5E306|nr:TetR family transcriptional regulator [Nocardia barduliensis]